MKSRLIASAIIEKDNMFLFGMKKQNKGPYPNTWHLIGGGVNLEQESIIDAIKREIKEEANIEVEILENLDFDEDIEPDKHNELTRYLFLVFRAKYLSGEIHADDDIEELKWFSKQDLKKIKLTRPSIKLFKKLGYI